MTSVIAVLDAGHAVHVLEAVEQVAFGVAVHVFEQVVGRVAARRALLRPAGHQVAGGRWPLARQRRQTSQSRSTSFSMRTSPARESAAPPRARRAGIRTVQPGHSPQRTAVCAVSSSQESLAAQGELAVAIRVGEEAQHVGHRQALAALAVALAAHAAVERARCAPVARPAVSRRAAAKGCAHGSEVLVELVHVGHAGNGGVDVRIAQHPLQRRQHARRRASASRRSGCRAACGRNPPAITFMATMPLPPPWPLHRSRVHERLHGEVVVRQDHVDVRILGQERGSARAARCAC